MSTFPVFFSMIKRHQGGAARLKFIILVSCAVSAVYVRLKSGGGDSEAGGLVKKKKKSENGRGLSSALTIVSHC